MSQEPSSDKEGSPVQETRNTRQKSQILKALRDDPGRHLTVEEIRDLIGADGGSVGVATLYRNLKLLVEQGLAVKVLGPGDGPPKYQIASHAPGTHTHHHMICKQCGSISDFREDLLEAIEKIILVTEGFTVTDHKVSFYGVCRKCARNVQPRKVR
jgi:Fur family ferric uptake transcriptional regulator